MNNKPYRRGSSLFRVRTPSLSTLETADLGDRFLTFLEHVENHNSMKKFEITIHITNMILIFYVK